MRIRRPTPAFLLAFVALLVALGGVATALPGKNNVDKNDLKKNVVESNNISKNGVKSSDVKNNTIKGKDLKDLAVKTDKIDDGAVTSSKTSFYSASALENVTAAASQAAAPEVTLLTRSPFTVYGKCFVDAGQVDAEVYIKTSEAGTLFSSNTDDKDGQAGAGYLNPGTIEEEREIQDDADAPANDADGVDQNENWFNATNGVIAIEGRVLNYAKQGTPAAGDGPFGAGNRCIFHAWLLNQAG